MIPSISILNFFVFVPELYRRFKMYLGMLSLGYTYAFPTVNREKKSLTTKVVHKVRLVRMAKGKPVIPW
jgi:hypothetical protein